MAKRYIKISPFYNRPSTAGPLSATRLNAINNGLDAVDLYKVDTDQIANNLITTAAGLVLDARQGRALQDQINTQNENLAKIIFETISVTFTNGVGTATLSKVVNSTTRYINANVVSGNMETTAISALFISNTTGSSVITVTLDNKILNGTYQVCFMYKAS